MVRSKAVNTNNKSTFLTIARLILAMSLLVSLSNFSILEVFSMNLNLFSAIPGEILMHGVKFYLFLSMPMSMSPLCLILCIFKCPINRTLGLNGLI